MADQQTKKKLTGALTGAEISADKDTQAKEASTPTTTSDIAGNETKTAEVQAHPEAISNIAMMDQKVANLKEAPSDPGTPTQTAKVETPTAAQNVGNAPPPQFDLQSYLNTQMAPIDKQLAQSVKDYSNADLNQSWMPDSIKPSIANLQKLTNSALKGLIPANNAQQHNFVAAQQASTIENLLPTALIYGALTGKLPNVQNQGVQTLWKLFENINLKSPNPAAPQNQGSLFSGLTGIPGSSSDPNTGASSTTGG